MSPAVFHLGTPRQLVNIWWIVKRIDPEFLKTLHYWISRVELIERTPEILQALHRKHNVRLDPATGLGDTSVWRADLIRRHAQMLRDHGFGFSARLLDDKAARELMNDPADFPELVRRILHEMEKSNWQMIPADRVDFFDNPNLFGTEVSEQFRGAVPDIQAAGRCYATDNPTACVFHCVRAAEHGMRRLARRMRIIKSLKHPLEYEEWGKVIDALNHKLDQIRKQPRGPRRDVLLRFYAEATRHCEHLNDLWRRDVSHARKGYEDTEALGALNHAREFMQLLARGLLGQWKRKQSKKTQ